MKVTIRWKGKADQNNSVEINALPDTGTTKSIISQNIIDSHGIPVDTERVVPLYTCNNQKMKTLGTAALLVDTAHKMTPVEAIVTCDMTDEFLISWHDLINMKIIDEDFPKVQCRKCQSMLKSTCNYTNVQDEQEAFHALLEEFQDVFNTEDGKLKPMIGPPMHIYLKKDVSIKPLKVLTARRTPIHLEEEAAREIDSLVNQGILKKVDHPTSWCSPSMFVLKPDGKSLRLVTDFRALNKYVERPVHPFPSASDIVSSIPAGTTHFVKFDALKGYFQIPLDPESMDLTAFMIPGKGRYVYQRAPMGLCSSGDEYCARGDAALSNVRGVKKIVDDILIWGSSFEMVMKRTKQVLERCRKNGITLSRKKANMGSSVKFAGFIVNDQGVSSDPGKLQALREFPVPQTITDLRSFLGLANQLNLCPDLAHATNPLRSLLKKGVAWNWLPEHQESFEKTKEILSHNSMLKHYDVKKEVELLTDASRLHGIGYALTQRDVEGRINIVQCGSRSLTGAETRYATIELELLAIVWAIRKCRVYLSARHFTVITDHKPLVGIFNKISYESIENNRVQSLLQKIDGYSFNINWVPGKNHFLADALSRNPVFQPNETDSELCYKVITRSSADNNIRTFAETAAADSDYQYVIKALKDNKKIINLASNHPARVYSSIWENISLDDSGLLLYNNRIIVPRAERRGLLDKLHMSHSGIERTRDLAKCLYYWPGITNDIKMLVEKCEACQKLRPSQPIEPLIRTSSSRPMEKVSVDLFQSAGKHYLVMVDRYSRFPFVEEMRRLDTNGVIKILKNWFLDWGYPNRLRSDNGPQFRGPFTKFCQEHNIQHELSSPYNSQSNGHAESCVKSMKYLLDKCNHDFNQFKSSLLEWRNTPSSGSEFSPAQLMMSRRQKTMLPVLDKVLNDKIQIDEEDNVQALEKGKQLSILNIGQHVRVQNPISKKWDQQGVITEKRENMRSYVVDIEGTSYIRNRRFLKPIKGHISDENSNY